MKLAVFAISLLLMQQPNAAPQQVETQVGTVEGMVVRAGTNEAISGAVVSWTSSVDPPNMFNGPNPNPTATTTSDGKFEFRNLKPATYRIFVTADGFVRQEYGQKIPDAAGRPVQLSAGQTVKDLSIPLTSSTTVTGRIVTDKGLPGTDVLVQLVRKIYTSNGPGFVGAGMANSDDRGEYRMFGVTPGRYYLVAGNVQVSQRPAPGAGDVISIRVSRSVTGVTFFPDAPDLNAATMIDLKPGTEFRANFTVKAQQVGYRISGRVIDADTGQPSTAANVSLASQFSPQQTIQPLLLAIRNTSLTPGTFEFLNVPPGAWLVRGDVRIQYPPSQGPIGVEAAAARSQAQALSPLGQAAVTVLNSDVGDIVVMLRAGATMPAQIVLDGGQTVSTVPNLDRVSIGIIPTTLVGGVSGTRPGTDGAFQISGVREGEYSVRALGLPQGYYLKSVRYAGKDVSNQTFRFSGSGSDALELILRQGTSQISGVVVDAKSQPVPGAQAILIPEESLRARTELYKTVTTDNSGRFVMPNVPPGNYKIFSWEAIEANGYYNPDVMKQSEAQGTAIKLEESLNRTTEVKWIPAVEN